VSEAPIRDRWNRCRLFAGLAFLASEQQQRAAAQRRNTVVDLHVRQRTQRLAINGLAYVCQRTELRSGCA
jgi:hypothetical protein